MASRVRSFQGAARSTSRFLAPSYFAVACPTHGCGGWLGKRKSSKRIKKEKVAYVRWGDEISEINVGRVEEEQTNKTLPKRRESLDEQLRKMLINK